MSSVVLKQGLLFSRRPGLVIKDHLWHIPEGMEEASFEFPGWSHPDVFGNENPVFLEYCSGNGSWIAAKAASTPFVNWAAIEMKGARVKKICSKVKRLRLDNLLVLWGEGCRVTKHYMPDESISGVHINFPDPWPKRHHAKHRLMQLEFVNELYRVLKKEGVLTFVTDDAAYSEWTIKLMLQHQGFESIYESPFYSDSLPDYGTSYFDQLWREKGKIIRYHLFKKR
jgi:tRNA (guanine-N7-)-methyltransferase